VPTSSLISKFFLSEFYFSSNRFNLYPRSYVISSYELRDRCKFSISHHRRTRCFVFFPLITGRSIFFAQQYTSHTHKRFSENENWSVWRKSVSIITVFQTRVCMKRKREQMTLHVFIRAVGNKSRSRPIVSFQSLLDDREIFAFLSSLDVREKKANHFGFSTFLATKSRHDRWHMSSAFHANNAK
jgi:hypothetical protein